MFVIHAVLQLSRHTVHLHGDMEARGCVGKTGGMNNVLLYKVVIGMDFSRDI